MIDQPLICIPDAIPAEKRATYDDIRALMQTESQSTIELEDGFALHFPNTAVWITRLAEFISLERLCCPFLTFALVVNTDQVVLHLTGTADGIKEFIRLELLI